MLGFSFSPGGLLLPYHLGVMDSLERAGHLTEDTPVAGSSAGAIAVACHACGLPSTTVLEATIALATECQGAGGARGRLINALRGRMRHMIGRDELERLQNRPGPVGIAYQEVFPRRRSVVQTEFTSLDDLIDAVSFSSTFPFFSDRWPVALDTRQSFPRLVVDGFFTVPRERLGCPDLNEIVALAQRDDEDGNGDIDECPKMPAVNEILVACFPQEKIGLTAVPSDRCISPDENAFDSTVVVSNPDDDEQTGMGNFIQLAMEASPASAYFDIYEKGLADGEAWSVKANDELWVPSDDNLAHLN